MRASLKKISKLTIIVVLAISLALPLSLVSSSLASAAQANTIDGTSSPEDQALSYWYYKAVASCFAQSSTSGTDVTYETDANNVSAGRLFHKQLVGYDKNVYGFYAAQQVSDIGSDGVAGCTANDNQLVQKALDFWKIDPVDLVCAMGYTRQNGQSCTAKDATNNFDVSSKADYAQAFRNYIIKTVYGGTAPALSGISQYQFYSQTLINACTTGGQNGSASKPKDASANAYYALITGTDSSGADVYTYYNATADRTHDWGSVYIEADSSATKTCGQVLDMANAAFPAYSGYLRCQSSKTYTGDASLMAACMSGALNSTNFNYCATNYSRTSAAYVGSQLEQSQKSERDACYEGQGNGSAGACLANTYTGSPLQACIQGSLHPKDPAFCTTTYLKDDTPKDATASQPNVDACKYGQSAAATSDVSTSNDVCTTNPNAASCGSQNNVTSCGSFVTGIGWIVCPMLDAIGGLNDTMWGLISGLLTANPLDQSGSIHELWVWLRNIANVLLVIGFLLIVMSQVSGFGVSNYGVKKTLPRLIIVAILVNASYYIVAISVDVFNILGSSIKDVLDYLAGQSKSTPQWGNILGLIVGAGGAVVIAGVSIALVGGIGAAVFLLLPGAVMALLGFLAALLTLMLRQALIPIVAVLAPLAFVAYMFPNTEQWFKKWRSMLMTLLLLYPIAALLFGGMKLVAYTIAGDNSNWFSSLTALVVMGAPLFMLPFLARQAGPMLGKINGAMGNLANRLKKPLSDYSDMRSRMAKNSAYSNNLTRRGPVGFVTRSRAKREAINASLEQQAKRAQTGYIADHTKDNEEFRGKMAGAGASQEDMMRVLANAQETKEKLEIDEVNASKVVIKNAELSGAERQTLATGKSVQKNGITYSGEAFQRAGIEEQLRTGSMSEIQQIMEYSATEEGSKFAGYIARNVAANGLSSKDPALAGSNIDMLSQGGFVKKDTAGNPVLDASGNQQFDWDKLYTQAFKDGRYTGDSLAGMNSDGRNKVIDWAEQQAVAGNMDAMNALMEAKAQIIATPTLQAKVTDPKSAGQLSRIP